MAKVLSQIRSIPYSDHGQTFDILESPRLAVLFHLRIELGDSVLFDIVAQFATGDIHFNSTGSVGLAAGAAALDLGASAGGGAHAANRGFGQFGICPKPVCALRV